MMNETHPFVCSPEVRSLNTEAQKGLKISIVTVSFNQRAYLQEAMDSVLGQSYPMLEYIVVDPGSSDGSRELIEHYRPGFPALSLRRTGGRRTV